MYEIGQSITILNPYGGNSGNKALLYGIIINKTETPLYPSFYTIKLTESEKIVVPYSAILTIKIEN